jgi:hypothetical protein
MAPPAGEGPLALEEPPLNSDDDGVTTRERLVTAPVNPADQTHFGAAASPVSAGLGPTSREHVTAALAVGISLVLLCESRRLLFPGIYGIADRSGTAATAGAVLFVGLAPMLTPLVSRVCGSRRRALKPASLPQRR